MPSVSDPHPLRLNLGCGPNALAGWINIDSVAHPGVDCVADLREPLAFQDVAFIYAEHFIEHLPYDDALSLMRECRRVLRVDGVLRLSTPNLDWVWASHYRRTFEKEEHELLGCFWMNLAFHGWGHQFLWNYATLRATLLDAGFGTVVRTAYGESAHPDLRGIERHEVSADFEGLSHILIVEASGRGGQVPTAIEEGRTAYRREINAR
jgi:predicted SAM-dependent methyltransferase